jgi:ParB family chromosome partitioning protein
LAKSNLRNLSLTSVDDLFETDESREDLNREKVIEIPLPEIDDFPDHPFKVRIDAAMQDMVESIKNRGVLTPATVRKKEDGRYELISGHRRKRLVSLPALINCLFL